MQDRQHPRVVPAQRAWLEHYHVESRDHRNLNPNPKPSQSWNRINHISRNEADDDEGGQIRDWRLDQRRGHKQAQDLEDGGGEQESGAAREREDRFRSKRPFIGSPPNARMSKAAQAIVRFAETDRVAVEKRHSAGLATKPDVLL
ncbi:MAG: hypothetical protein ACREQX_14755, partial [Candidatus Binataceae bacterium]